MKTWSPKKYRLVPSGTALRMEVVKGGSGSRRVDEGRGILMFGMSLLGTVMAANAIDFRMGPSEILLPQPSAQFEVADYDHDGDSDILVVSGGAPLVYLNDGLGVFESKPLDFGTSELLSVRLFDADGEGFSDFWITFEDGTGGVVRRTDDLEPDLENLDRGFRGDGAVWFGDVDGDGDADAVVAHSGSAAHPSDRFRSGYLVWLNDGPDGFERWKPLQYLDSGDPLGGRSGWLADLNGDEALDFVAAYEGGVVRVWMNDGAGQFQDSGQRIGRDRPVVAGDGFEGVLLDSDSDGDLDMIQVSAEGSGRLWVNDGSGVFADAPLGLVAAQSRLVAGDLDRDGDADLLSGSAWCRDCKNVWLQEEGRLTPSRVPVFGENISVRRLHLADLDADTDLDCVALVEIVEAPAGRVVIGIWFNDLIDLSLMPPELGSIRDRALASLLRLRLDLPADLSITPDYSLLRTLSVSRADFGAAFVPIKDLSGLEDATALESLVLDGVLELPGEEALLDLRFLESLTSLRFLSLPGNGIRELILPANWTQLESLSLNDNQLTTAAFLEAVPGVSRLNLARNEFQKLDLSGRPGPVQTLDISGNPLTEVVIPAGIETLTPRVDALRRSGIGVAVPPRLRALRRSPEGRARFELFADAGSYLIQRSEDLRQWRTVGEVEVAQSLWPAVFFEGDSPELGATAFYSVIPSFIEAR